MQLVKIQINNKEIKAWELQIRHSCYYITPDGDMYYHIICRDNGFMILPIVAQATRQLLWERTEALGISIPYTESNKI